MQPTVVKKPNSVSTTNEEKKTIATASKNTALKKNIKTATNSKAKIPPGTFLQIQLYYSVLIS